MGPRIGPEIDGEIKEVAGRSGQDGDPARLRHGLGSRRGCKAFLDFPPSPRMLTLNKVDSPCLRGYRAWSAERTLCTDSKTRSNIDSGNRPASGFRCLGGKVALGGTAGRGQIPSFRNSGTAEGRRGPVPPPWA